MAETCGISVLTVMHAREILKLDTRYSRKEKPLGIFRIGPGLASHFRGQAGQNPLLLISNSIKKASRQERTSTGFAGPPCVRVTFGRKSDKTTKPIEKRMKCPKR